VTHVRRRVWIHLACWGLASWVAAGAVTDEGIDRPLIVRRDDRSARPRAQLIAPRGGRPSDFEPREFPSVLWDPARSSEPDGILWRRLRAKDPAFDARAFLTPDLAQMGARLAAAAGAPPDTVRILLLRVDFLQDGAGAGSTTPDGRFDLRSADSTDIIADPPPHNQAFFESHMQALQRYYWKQSGGQLVLKWDVYPAGADSAYHLADTKDYGPWTVSNSETILSMAEKFVRDAFAAADTSAQPPDFRRYDSFLLFHAGTDLQGDINRDTPYDIPSFNLFMADPVAVQDSSFFMDLIMVVPESVSQDGYTAALNGVLAHEFGHQLGFYDLYDVLTYAPMVGMFSLMDSGEQLYGTVAKDSTGLDVVYVRGAIPASLDPWHKLLFFPGGVQAGWVARNGRVTLPAVQTGNRLALVPIGGQWLEYVDQLPGWWAPWYASEYFVMENRPYDLNGDGSVILETDPQTGVFLGPGNIEPGDAEPPAPPDTLGAYEQDYLLPGSGILIWHIDNAAIQAASNVCGGCINISLDRRGVDVEEADGIQDLGDIYSVEWTGGVHDYWSLENYSVFGPQTRPDTRSGAGGATGIQIAVVDSAAFEMQASIKLGYTRGGWPVYAGDPLSDESVTITDADGQGTLDIFAAGGRDVLDRYGREVLAFAPDGAAYPFADATGEFAMSDSVLLPGVAIARGFVAAQGAEALIATASETRVYAWDPYGAPRLRYPDGEGVLPTLRFTTPPTLLDSVLVVGDSEGRVRGLLPGAENELLWRSTPARGAVTRIAAGDLFGDGSGVLAVGDALGGVGVLTGTQRGGFALAPGWPRSLDADGSGIDALLLVEGPAGEAGRLIAVDRAGDVAVFDAGGELADGWPRSIGSAPAGPPVVGDPDGDGVLEIVITGEDGRIHCFQWQGTEEMRWPHSVWSPDVTPFSRVRSGARLADLDGDGRIEFLQGSGDGTLHALRMDGGELPGFPVVAGYPIIAGPFVAGLGEGGALQLLAVDAMGFATVLDLGLPVRSEGPGEMWGSDGGPARRHVYARERLPQPAAPVAFLDEASLVFAPNPVRGETGVLRFRMGEPGRLRLALFDTHGDRVWAGERTPDSFDEETIWELGLGDLASGLYIARITAEGGGRTVRLTRKLAIVR
jgi:M6 family metalloprotease-like protein